MHSVPAVRRRIVLSTVSSDAHTWNLVFLQMLLEETGHEVINLGPCVPDDLVLDTARREQPDAIVISTVNGHGQADGARMARLIRSSPETLHIPMMIGGKLGIANRSDQATVRELLDAGFDYVFTDEADLSALSERLTRLPAGAN